MKKRLFFDMDNVLVDFQSGLDRIDEETKNKYRAKGPDDKDRLDEIPGLFGKMDPMPGLLRLFINWQRCMMSSFSLLLLGRIHLPGLIR